MGSATRLAGAFDVTPYAQARTYSGMGFVSLAQAASTPEAQAKAAFAVKYGHAVPENLAEAEALNDMVAAAKAKAATVSTQNTVQIKPSAFVSAPLAADGPRPPMTGVSMVVLAAVAGTGAFLVWPRAWSAGGPTKRRRKSRRGSRRSYGRRRRRNPSAGRGTTLLAIAGIGAGVFWAARRLAAQVSAVVPTAEAMVDAVWTEGGASRAAGLGCGSDLAGVSTPGYYL